MRFQTRHPHIHPGPFGDEHAEALLMPFAECLGEWDRPKVMTAGGQRARPAASQVEKFPPDRAGMAMKLERGVVGHDGVLGQLRRQEVRIIRALVGGHSRGDGGVQPSAHVQEPPGPGGVQQGIQSPLAPAL